jgi:type I restriction-modification system DNA methylase subunit
MAKKKQDESIKGTDKEFLNLFQDLCFCRSPWQVWTDLMTVMACAISNVLEKDIARRNAREKEYEGCIKRLGGSNEIPAQLLNIVTMAFETNPDQDFLGKMFMNLDLGSHWHGQFFTPYNVCRLMSEMTVGSDAVANAKTRDYIAVSDPACGAGATLIAAANVLKNHGINYQEKVIFAAQDIDRVAAMMCYIQLSLLGCPGYVVVADTLSNPLTGSSIEPTEREDQEFWYTPFYYTDTWTTRRFIQRLKFLRSHNSAKEQKTEKEEYVFFFEFKKEGNLHDRAELRSIKCT